MARRSLAYVMMVVAATPLAAQCRLCGPDAAPSAPARAARPLNIEIESALDMGRAAMAGSQGSIALDERSGARRVEGLTDLGGFALTGRVRLTGEPFARVRVSLPSSIVLIGSDGSRADAVDIRTDLVPDPALDANGTLSFAFGARLVVTGQVSGDLHGRIPITADYQ